MALIFIGGSQRTGTTLLQTILCKDKTTNPMLHEAKYFRQLIQAYVFGKRQFNVETHGFFSTPEDLRIFHSGVVKKFTQHLRGKFNNIDNIILKEPHLTMLFPDIAELLPRSRFICMMRDPRDVIASMIDVGKKLSDSGIDQDPMARIFNTRNMNLLSQHFKSFYLPVLQNTDKQFGRRCLFVKYEDLVMTPGPVLETLRKFTGLTLDGYDLSSDPGTGKVEFESADPYRSAWVTKLYGKKISNERIGTYKNVLNESEVNEIENACPGIFKRFNYPVSSSIT